MDYRSLNLKFEADAIIYDPEIACQLSDIFTEGLKQAKRIDKDKWLNRPKNIQLREEPARLVGPLL